MCFAQSPNICIKKESLNCLCSHFCLCSLKCFFISSSLLFIFFSLGTAYSTSFVYTLYIEKKIYHSFLFVNTDVSQATFPVSFVH